MLYAMYLPTPSAGSSYNRTKRLEDMVEQAFRDFSETTVEIRTEELAWGTPASSYLNPLQLYPNLLNQTLQGKKSMVHGDLHLRNVLVDDNNQGRLIDFALVTERHNLYDFIKLETYIRQMILSQKTCGFSFAAYLQFEEAPAAASLGQPTPEDSDLHKAFQVIQALREMAGHYMGHPVDFRQKYFPALFLYNLAVLKYYDNHGPQAARLAFAAAVVVGRALTEDEPTSLLHSLQHDSVPVIPPPRRPKKIKGRQDPRYNLPPPQKMSSFCESN
jgi:hypothetical protein